MDLANIFLRNFSEKLNSDCLGSSEEEFEDTEDTRSLAGMSFRDVSGRKSVAGWPSRIIAFKYIASAM